MNSPMSIPVMTEPPNKEPVLLSKLRTALSHLYTINAESTHFSPHCQKEANTYLIEFQSRNIRRKIRSFYQRKNDSTNKIIDGCNKQHDKKLLFDRGSSFYACLPLLFKNNISHQSERLFCSQTILHRLRRMKVCEAIDWEIEFQDFHDDSNHAYFQPHALSEKNPNWWANFVKFYGENLSSIHMTFLGQVLNRYYQETWSVCCSDDSTLSSLPPAYAGVEAVDLEERIKGEMTILILASAAYFSVFLHTIQTGLNKKTDDSTIGSHAITEAHSTKTTTTEDIEPFIGNLFSAMSLIAMRLRYTPNFMSSRTPGLSTPIVALLMKTLEHVDTIVSSLPMHYIIPPPSLNTDQQNLFYEMPPDEKVRMHTRTLNRCICDALASIPDSLLGSPGGARGRLSIDPKCLQAACLELRCVESGTRLLKDAMFCALSRSREGGGDDTTSFDQIVLQHRILLACERWVKFVPLPMDFVEETLKLVVHVFRSHLTCPQKNIFLPMVTTAFAYLIRIYEGACMTKDQIIAASVGLSNELGDANRQQGSKRQSSKSKKRHKERVQDAVNGSGNTSAEASQKEEAERELYYKGLVACRATLLSWEVVHQFMMNSLELVRSTSNKASLLEGEGPIGCVCACASACLPHIIKYHDGTSAIFGEAVPAFFGRVIGAFKLVCFHAEAPIRALSYEHILTIHSALLDKTKDASLVLSELESTAMHSICSCALALASSCAYPPGYFSDLSLDNDEDLEIERNDVRDIIRSITSFGSGDIQMPLLSYMILDCILEDCANKISSSTFPPENIVHTLSSLAKPLNRLAQDLVSNSTSSVTPAIENILTKALACLHSICSKLLLFSSTEIFMSDLIPVGRLVCLTIAALAPSFSALAEGSQFVSGNLSFGFHQALGSSFLAAVTCAANLPELIAQSSLGSTIYDIRGAMRSPGGEDHVGCIALKHLSESNALAIAALKCASLEKQDSTTSIIADLCRVHEMLYEFELERGADICHGKGMTPISRRILLRAISKIGLTSINNSLECTDSMKNELYKLLQRSLVTMQTANGRGDITEAEKIFQICEAGFDLSSFPSTMISSLFSNGVQNQEIKCLMDAGVLGYGFISNSDCVPSTAIIQWGRLRGSILCLLRASSNPGLPALATASIIALNHAECEAVSLQCRAGSFSQSPIFNEKVICEDTVAAGAFIIVVRDTLDNIHQELQKKVLSKEQADNAISSCISALIASKDSVFSVLGLDYPESDHGCHIDPRPTISEAWFLTIVSLLEIYKYTNAPIPNNTKELTYDTLALCVHILLLKQSDKEESGAKQDHVLGMSLDGPQSLALVDFINTALGTGSDAFMSICKQYESRMRFDSANIDPSINCNPRIIGGAIIAAALFRGSSGALPPWVIESLPKLYCTLFECCEDIETFCLIIRTGADLRLKDASFARVCAGKKLAGYFFDKMSEKSVDQFLIKTKAICSMNDNSKWRNFKVLLKAMCGGKKKASMFNLKPQPTDWDCVRI